MSKLSLLSEISDSLEYLISNGNGKDEEKTKLRTIEKICADITEEIKNQGLSDFSGDSAEGHAYAVNSRITDPEIRNLHILYAV